MIELRQAEDDGAPWRRPISSPARQMALELKVPGASPEAA
jgi:hypothetical protein